MTTKYKGFVIRTTILSYKFVKYDVIDGQLYSNSVGSIKEAKEYINQLIWYRNNVPF